MLRLRCVTWLLLLATLVGYFRARCAVLIQRGMVRHAAGALSLVIAPLVVLPGLYNLSPTPWAEYAGAVSGAILGSLVAYWVPTRDSDKP